MMKNASPALLLLFLFFVSSTAIGSQTTYPPLRTAGDPVLQAALEDRLSALGLDNAIEEERLALALVDITDPARPRLAAVNGDHMMYAASLPKIAILLGAMQGIEDGRLTPDASLEASMSAMIRNSSNTAATEVMRRAGPEYIADVLRSPEYALYDPEHNGGLWVGKEYGKAAAWQRDPLFNISHGATAIQAARFYYLMAARRLVSIESSKRMQSFLADPAIRHKFVRGLNEAAPTATVYRKSGTWRRWHADSALVEHGEHRYIAVALAQSARGGAWLKESIIAVHELVCGPGETRRVAGR